MSKRFRISLLDHDEDGNRKRCRQDPDLRFTVGRSTKSMLKLGVLPAELRQEIYRYAFDESMVVDGTKLQVPQSVGVIGDLAQKTDEETTKTGERVAVFSS